jgi:hypothetical protein
MALLAAALVVGCGDGDARDQAAVDSLDRDLQMAPVDTSATLSDQPTTQPSNTPATRPRPATTTPRESGATLGAGTSFAVTAAEEVSSGKNKAGETFTTTVASDVKNSRGVVVIPAGSTVNLTISQIEGASNKGSTGKIVLVPSTVLVGGKSYQLAASIDSVGHQLKSGGVSTGDAAKVGAGAAAGAIAGRVISGNSKGAIIGGVVGAAVGTGVAIETKDREVVVPVGSRIVLTLTEDMTVTG